MEHNFIIIAIFLKLMVLFYVWKIPNYVSGGVWSGRWKRRWRDVWVWYVYVRARVCILDNI